MCVFSVEGHCYLKCGDVVKLLMDILSDDSKCEMFGPELTSVILKDVLSIRASWFSLNAPLCQGESEAKQMYCWFTSRYFGKVDTLEKAPLSDTTVSWQSQVLHIVNNWDPDSCDIV